MVTEVKESIGSLTRRSGSVPGTARRAPSDDVMSIVRRHLEATEEKLSVQIGKVQQQSDKLRETAFARVDAKLCGFESAQPKFDRRLAELSGNYQGLSDEVQSQIRRVDQLDTRLRTWRQELEEMIRAKFSELERSNQQIISTSRVSSACSEDNINRWTRRLIRLEGVVDERMAAADDVNQSLLNLHARLSQIEEGQEVILSPVQPISREADGGAMAVRWLDESHDLHARMEAQEERLKSLRTLIDTREDCVRALSDRLERTDCDARLRELHDRVQETEKCCHELGLHKENKCSDRLAELEKRFEDVTERNFTSVGDVLQQLKQVAPRVMEHEAMLQDLTAYFAGSEMANS
ncbi:unnamed protein product [Effrenium voratum]|uniref:Uncharacterized protein n=1 Tax=Effrenium voratum TaxID=2562239 RepID=A0AA36MRG7_9DINO|nr:unnamed protein product [Effrenium voratum]CAJ1420954.1 unnamed protein product [Effrenium voratum]